MKPDECTTQNGEAARYGTARSVRFTRAAWRPLLAAGAALTLANCAGTQSFSGRHASELKYGVKSSPRVIPEGQPIPKGGGREMIGNPYMVAGRTYVPRDGKGYDREGAASWYGTAFHGRLTANGEIFDRESIAAAHPTLPLPSYVRVTNKANGRSLVVRVNDRGPYERNRLIDLSERAAQALGFHRHGTTQVRVQYLGRASTAGSDDEKLLATLRNDDIPTGSDERRKPVMVAHRPGLGDRFAVAGEAPASPLRRTSPALEEPRPQPVRRTIASSEGHRAQPLDIAPSSEGGLGALY